jgi:hypothetical protein
LRALHSWLFSLVMACRANSGAASIFCAVRADDQQSK